MVKLWKWEKAFDWILNQSISFFFSDSPNYRNFYISG